MAKVLVVGGAGYVGGWMTDELSAAGHDVMLYDGLLYEDSYLKPVKLLRGDILDEAALLPHLRWADCVVWLAAIVGDPAAGLDPDLTVRTNLDSVKFLTKNFNGRILFPSTCSVYGAQDGELREDCPTGPLSLYAETKLEAERCLMDSGANAAIFRLGTLYGLSDTYSRLRVDLVLNVLTIRAVLSGRLSVFGGRQFRPLLHVRDVSSAFVPSVEGDHVGIYNLHERNMTILELAERVRMHIPEAEIVVTETSFQDSRNYSVSSELARSTFGFSPRWTVDQGIEEIAKVIREGRISDTSIARYSNHDQLRPLLKGESTPLGRLLGIAGRIGG